MAIDTIKSTAVLDGAIATADIADANITTAKIADANITTAKIADDAVTSAKLDTNIAISGTLNTNNITTGNTSIVTGGRFISSQTSNDPWLKGVNSSNTETSYIKKDGQIYSAFGISVGGTGAENTLDDYEEGRFDILFADSDSGSETLSMRYTKVGQVVHVEGPNRGSAGSSNGQYAILSAVSNSNINITCSLPFVPIESGSAISPIHRNLELRSSGTTPVSGYWRPILAWQAASATVYLADTQGAGASEHAYWGGVNGQTLRKQDNRTNIVVGFNFSYRTAS